MYFSTKCETISQHFCNKVIPAWWEGGELLALDTTTASLALLTHHTKWGSRDTFGLYCHDLGWKGRGGGYFWKSLM